MLHKKAERVIKVRKMSVVGENGEVSWVRSEFTSLVCPASDVSKNPVMSSDVCAGTPNKKQRINLEIVSDQSAPEAKPDVDFTT